jgi:predicted Zn finger-like uncharacterized protein
MYTQCPECRIYFRITPAQLEARHGLVRCGQCAAVFQASDRLLDKLPTSATPATGKTSPPPARPAKKTRRRASRPKADSDSVTPELVAPLLFPAPPRRARWRLAGWLATNLLLVTVTAAQIAYLYRLDLAEYPALRPMLAAACEWLECKIERTHNVNRIEFETSIAPHPKFTNALRLRADLVNRAERAQPFPILEITLTDSGGHTLARRQFDARQYLAEKTADRLMMPNVAAHALLDLTNPDNRAVGYEVRLLPGA